MSLLFDTPLIEGLRYAEAAISVGEERELLDRLEPLDLAPFRFHGWLGNRRTQSFDRAADDMANYLFDFVRLNRRERIELRNKTERLGEQFDWSTLVKHYHQAHDLAMERVGAPRAGDLKVRMI